MIDIYDSMLKETAGNFGKGKLGGDKYISECCVVAEEYIKGNETKEEILRYIDKKIQFYELEKEWIYQTMELDFLYQLSAKIEEIKI